MRIEIMATVAALCVSACGSKTVPNNPAAANLEAAADTMDAAANEAVLAPNVPVPNYDEREGDRYLYSTAVSEDDRKKGKAVGDVLQYRYLGEQNGLLRIEQVAENGGRIDLLECRRDCRIIKTTFWRHSIPHPI